jgi:putative polyhydroxyalkanoate system protein
MSQILISRPHEACMDELKIEAEELAEKLKKKFGIKSKWLDDYHLHFEGMDVTGQIFIEENNITVDVKLGLLGMLMKSKIEHELTSYLDEKIG